MEKHSLSPEYRSPKTAARDIARLMLGGASVSITERAAGTSTHNPESHEPYPRAIETKPERFALTTALFERVADTLFVGAGNEIRLPALAKVRDDTRISWLASGPHFSERDAGFLRLRDDLYEAKDIFRASVQAALDDPRNVEAITAYHEIVEDIATDPATEESYFSSADGREELLLRLDVSGSFELETSAYFLVKWGLELASEDRYPSADDKRKFIISIADFFEKFSQLEINHSNQYFHSSDHWNDLTLTAADAGMVLRDDYEGNPQLFLKNPLSKPPKSFGRPIGCPIGFDPTPIIESTQSDSDAQELPPMPSGIKRLLTAYVNEAYDRGLLE